MRHAHAILSAAFAVAVLSLSGCGGPARVEVQLAGRTPMNVNESNESTPVQVRIYQLRSDARFRGATVEALWTQDKDVLKDDLIGAPTVTTVLPAGAGDPAVKLGVELDAATTHLGVLALFSKADAKDNRAVVVPVADAGRAVLALTGYSVAIELPAGK